MEWIGTLIGLFVHLDRHLNDLVASYGGWSYAILFLVIFCETGLVVTPFLPGDSLLFAVGALCATTPLRVEGLFLLLSIAALLGDTVNYWMGHYVGPRIFDKEKVRFLNKEHLRRAQAFYEKYGGKTIVIARFVPIIRTFAPFVAGIGCMRYGYFMAYNVIGGLIWVTTFLFGGYFFGNLPWVKTNFTLVILVIIILSILPGVIEYARARAVEKGSCAPRP